MKAILLLILLSATAATANPLSEGLKRTVRNLGVRYNGLEHQLAMKLDGGEILSMRVSGHGKVTEYKEIGEVISTVVKEAEPHVGGALVRGVEYKPFELNGNYYRQTRQKFVGQEVSASSQQSVKELKNAVGLRLSENSRQIEGIKIHDGEVQKTLSFELPQYVPGQIIDFVQLSDDAARTHQLKVAVLQDNGQVYEYLFDEAASFNESTSALTRYNNGKFRSFNKLSSSEIARFKARSLPKPTAIERNTELAFEAK